MARFMITWWIWSASPWAQSPGARAVRTWTVAGKVARISWTASRATPLSSKGADFSSLCRLKERICRFSSRARVTAW